MFYISLKEKNKYHSVFKDVVIIVQFTIFHSLFHSLKQKKKDILKNVHNQTLANDLKSMATSNFLVKNRVFLSSTEGGNS